MSDTLCTLFEGHYHLGAAALINSLHRSGFAGTVVCGYRGSLPFWHATPAAVLAPIRIIWSEIKTSVHFTNYKPVFMLECLSHHTPDAERIYYSDPDIVVKAPWSIFTRWALDGVALCEDLNASLPARHPYRLAWLDFLGSRGFCPTRSLDRYYNAGFLGLPKQHVALLSVWTDLLSAAKQHLGALDRLKAGKPHDLFHTTDQDALNMALLLGDWPLNTTGPEGMDFIPGGSLLSHAAGGIKPWRRGFVRAALQGRPPGPAQKRFYDHVEGPIRVFPPAELRSRRRELAIAALIGRFYRRS
jgi:hypothetical protein